MSDNNGSPKTESRSATNGIAGNDSPGTGQAVLVIGAGIGGMQSTLLLAEAGYPVYLLDSAPGIGGSMHLLDRTFPTDSCGICLMLPGRAAYCPTIECDLHPNVEILPYAEIVDVRGEPGDFSVTVRRKPRYVDIERCTNCGLCAEVCPIERPHQYEGDIKKQKAIYQPPVRAIPPAYVIDMDYCTRCGQCVDVCPTDAIDLDMEAATDEIAVGALIMSPGYEPFDAGIKGEYGFGHYDNVLSSIQFERMVSIAGSTGARIVRPSDGEKPQRIAFIQCVGSRDPSIDRGYCSSVCCMYTAKQVKVAKELEPDLDVTVFFMDIRAHGKDFDEYFDQVEATLGVSYRRAMVSSIHDYKQTGNLRLDFVGEDGTVHEEDFDMVVLALGFEPPQGFRELGQALAVDLNRCGFGVTDTFHPTASSRSGILVSGAFREPKDIPGTVVEASAVAASAAGLVRRTAGAGSSSRAGASEDMGQESAWREERNVAMEWPRVGVFLCDCHGEVGSVVNLQAVSDYAEGLQDVALVQVLDNACLMSGRQQIAEAIEENELNRVVIAGCPAREYQAAFESTMRGAGLNAGLMERVNLRGEVAWVHQGNGTQATAKAEELVAMGVAGVRMAQPVRSQKQELSQRVLVIGGGLAGMTSALSLAEMGYEVDLVEQSADLGGQLRSLRYTLTGEDPVAFLDGLIEDVERSDLIHVYREAEVEDVSGWVGAYKTALLQADGERMSLEHGAIIVATGGHEVMPNEYLYEEDPRVVTQRELEKMLDAGDEVPSGRDTLNTGDVVMIQCVGSREPERPYCSRVCCTKAVTNALRIREQHPEARVFVLYREMRTYGFREDLYREARQNGVAFLRYELPNKPEVSADDQALTIRLQEPVTGDVVELKAGTLVLSTGIDPNDVAGLADMLEIPLDKNGFFQEEYPKMRPLDFTRRGIFMCGLAHSPRFSDEAIVQAQGAAMRASALLKQQTLEAPIPAVEVSERLCTACGQCVEVCPYGARVLEPGAHTAEVIEVLCQGCGACIVACPNKATRRKGVEMPSVYRILESVI
jgi:heterodisulfide reductase subunit A